LQSWGDHTGISQAVVMYVFALGNACLYCWLGSELSEQVGKIMLSNHSKSYLSLYFYQRKNIFLYSICNRRNFPPDIVQAFVSGIIYRLSEQSVSDILRNLRSTHNICNTNFLKVTRMNFIILSNSFNCKSRNVDGNFRHKEL